jgi:hypothetical protein
MIQSKIENKPLEAMRSSQPERLAVYAPAPAPTATCFLGYLIRNRRVRAREGIRAPGLSDAASDHSSELATCWRGKGLGGREGIRTPGLLVANEALSQLSYSPTSSNKILANGTDLANRTLWAVFTWRPQAAPEDARDIVSEIPTAGPGRRRCAAPRFFAHSRRARAPAE